MHIRLRVIGKPEMIVVVESKLTKIDQLRRLVRDKVDVEPKLQRLFYGGKELDNGYTFHDYNIKINDVIQLIVKSQNEEKAREVVSKNKEEKENKIVYYDAKSKLYVIGDLVDVRDQELGAWHEGKIVRIVADPSHHDISSSENISPNIIDESSSSKKNIRSYFSKGVKEVKSDDEFGLLYQVQLDNDDEDDPNNYYKLKDIRPRARNLIEISDLKVGQCVMINQDTEDPTVKGHWYDFKVSEIKKLQKSYELIGTLYLGPEAVPQHDSKIKLHDSIYAIEKVVPLSKRSEKCNKIMNTPTEKRSQPLNCLQCRDNESVLCKDCGCFWCGGKQNPDKIVLCDECNNGYHLSCLPDPLTEIPDEDWYCPSCKRDPNDVIAPGGRRQVKKDARSTKDWGRGMACVGKTKTCAMPPNHFGPIPGIEVGMTWRFRIQLSESGVHRPPVSGIHGRDVEGAYSIVLSGGYEDDYDNGTEFTYTGSGGRDLSGNKRTAEQSCDQTLTRENKALARNCAVKLDEGGADSADKWREGKPVRVVRSYKMVKHFPQYAPKEGIRYDGIYKVVKYYPERGLSGFKVWKYLLRRDDPVPAPWEPGAKQFDIVYPDGYLEAEAEKKALKQKANAKSKGKKRKAREDKASTTDEDADASSKEPQKKKTKNDVTPKVTRNRARESKDTSLKDSPEKSARKSTQKESIDNVISDKELEAIKADKLNEKLWDECLDILRNNGKQQFIEHVTQVFLCIICQEVVAGPVTTPCSHNFCMGCIKLAFKSTNSKSCPYCRGCLSEGALDYNEELKCALKTIMPGYDAKRKC